LLQPEIAEELIPLADRLHAPDGVNTFAISSVAGDWIKTRRGRRARSLAGYSMLGRLEDLSAEASAELDAVSARHRKADGVNNRPSPQLKLHTPWDSEIRRLVELWQLVFLRGDDSLPTMAAIISAARATDLPVTERHVRNVFDSMKRK